MSWINWLTVGLVASNAGLCVFSGITAWRERRLYRHMVLLDQLLGRICIDAFRMRHMPIWQAWSNAMGQDIAVEISATRREPEANQ